MTTADGIEFVRTPDICFQSLPDWPYQAKYVEIDGLRQAYIDEGDPDGPLVLLLHGQPSWSYLYHKMIPILSAGGFRVIAMDHLGMGRSDKPINIGDYSYLGHHVRLERFIKALELRDINLFAQDWGSLIGLRVAGMNPDWFARIVVANGTLPLIAADKQPFPAVQNPDEMVELQDFFGGIPAQQKPYYADCNLISDPASGNFADWINYAMKGSSFKPSSVVEALTWLDLPNNVAAAYDAPFPTRKYMAGPRSFPSLINELSGINDEAWVGLSKFEKPFLTLWAANDPGSLGTCETQQSLVNRVPGARGLPHKRLEAASHFLQEDQGEMIAKSLIKFFSNVPLRKGDRYCEILLAKLKFFAIEAEVWGTPGLNYCPADSWDALDAKAIKK
ncbi:MAG: haloalkane dehalogenase, partial [Kangiellaceae bacterium]|nr:haloalkane dehalogenase [Kangiellaceae bacterium]